MQVSPLDDLNTICEEIFDRWDADMKPGKLLSALSGRLPKYDPRVTRIREILAQQQPSGETTE